MKIYRCANYVCKSKLVLKREPKVGEVAICGPACARAYRVQQALFKEWLKRWEPKGKSN